MRAVVYDEFRQAPSIRDVREPELGADSALIRVEATGLCRSDWHGWMGHDPDIALPHVPGHEFAGVVERVGPTVESWKSGDRVTAPFVCACGECPPCRSGNEQVCDRQSQPGFTHWGSFAEFVAVRNAELNLVRLPDDMEFTTAASLGCRFATSFRAIVDQGRVEPGQWVAVFGCGGVGLSAVMIARARGARVLAVDVDAGALELARTLGADQTIDARDVDPATAIRAASHGGAHVSMDAFGSARTAHQSVSCLRKRGRHVQVGLMVEDDRNSPIPMDRVVADELEIVGSHGVQASRYAAIFELIQSADLAPERLIGATVGWEGAARAIAEMGSKREPGITLLLPPDSRA